MVEKGLIHSIEELLECPEVTKARSIGVPMEDSVHFRLMQPEHIFQVAELHLERRHPGKYKGYAKCRAEAEQAMRGSSIPDKIAVCCTRFPEWLDGRQILYSTELEVWMDMSYPNPLTLQLYHAVLMAGKQFVIRRRGQFSETFHTLLKEKNEYELTSEPLEEDQTVEVLVGDHMYAPEDCLNLAFPRRAYRVHPFASEPGLGGQLANGILEKAVEDHSAAHTADEVYIPHSIGYRLIGPTLLLLIQALLSRMGAAGFVGPGAEMLENLARSIKGFWPALPEVAHSGKAMLNYSIFPEKGSSTSLFPDTSGECASILSAEDLAPVDLTLPPVKLFFKAMLDGQKGQQIRKAAEVFVQEYASLTRGLVINLPPAPVASSWRETILVPEPEVLEWATREDGLPGFAETRNPWQLEKALREGPWPSASYLMARGFSRWWTRKKIPHITSAIQSSKESC
jgi:hypothetical protein